jgi:hypothetical protein
MYNSDRLRVQVFGSVLSRVTGYHVLCFPQSLLSIIRVFSNNHGPLITAYLFPIKQHYVRRQTPNLQRKKVSTNFTKTRSHLKIKSAKWETRSKFNSLLRTYNRYHRTKFGHAGEIAPGICVLLH